MASIRLDRISKTFDGATAAVRGLSLDVPDGCVTAVLGPSGCGKTTVLRLIAGLEKPDSGEVLIGGKSAAGVEPRRRNVAMLFQDHSLYPHMTIARNIAFAADGPARDRSRVDRIVAVLGVEPLLERKPHTLSGGQRRRAALAKALARDCDAYLLDEPLNSLDAPARAELRASLRSLLDSLGCTVVYVTHDQAEAMTLADRICVMACGQVQQVSSAEELLESPANAFVARFAGTPPMNLIRGRLVNEGSRWCFAFADACIVLADHLQDAAERHGGAEAILGLRPQLLRFTTASDSAAALAASVKLVEARGPYSNVHLQTACGQSLIACVQPHAAVACGQNVHVAPEAAGMMLFNDGEFGANLAAG